jgi:hypothetical protein
MGSSSSIDFRTSELKKTIKMACVLDPDVMAVPKTLKEHFACRCLDVKFSITESSQQVINAGLTARLNDATICTPNFNAVT